MKLTTLVNEVSDAKADLTKKFGPRSSETAFPMQNAMGASWEDHLSVWDTPAVYARFVKTTIRHRRITTSCSSLNPEPNTPGRMRTHRITGPTGM